MLLYVAIEHDAGHSLLCLLASHWTNTFPYINRSEDTCSSIIDGAKGTMQGRVTSLCRFLN